MYNNKPRRSMGTLPSRGALRVSQSGMQATPLNKPTGGKGHSSATRIPRPSDRGVNRMTSGSSMKRSSSSNRPSSTFMTPMSAHRSRSQSSSRTPQRVLQSSNNYLNVPQNMNRFSSGSMRSSSIGTKAAVKDSRGLQDQSSQAKAIQSIKRFVQEHAGRTLSDKDFPVNSTDFKNLFAFFMTFLDPSFEMPKTKLELEIPKLLKTLGYPHQVSKSAFQTLGTRHSWPQVLGVLQFIMGLAESQINIDDRIDSLVLPQVDEHGLPTDEPNDNRMVFRCLINSYASFNGGADDFQEELESFRLELEAAHGVDHQSLKKLDKTRHELKETLRQLQKDLKEKDDARARLELSKRDYQEYKKYLIKKKDYKEKTKEQLHLIEKRKVALENKLQEAKQRVDDLKDQIQSKGSAVDRAQVDMKANELHQKMRTLELQKADLEKARWSKEMQLSQAQEDLDNLQRKFNSELMVLDLDKAHEDSMRLDMASCLESMRSVRQKVSGDSAELGIKIDAMENERFKLKAMKTRLDNDLNDVDAQSQTMNKELIDSESQTQTEDKELSDGIKRLVVELNELREQGEVNIEALQKEVGLEESKVAELQKTMDKEFEAGMDYLFETSKTGKELLKETEARRDRMFKRMDEALNEELISAEALKTEIQRQKKLTDTIDFNVEHKFE